MSESALRIVFGERNVEKIGNALAALRQGFPQRSIYAQGDAIIFETEGAWFETAVDYIDSALVKVVDAAPVRKDEETRTITYG